jgi:hypothetical protein
MPAGPSAEVHGTSCFRVFIGKSEVGFAVVGPISSQAVVGDPGKPPRDGYATVTLRRALTGTTELFDWRRAIAAGKPDRRAVIIQQLDRADGSVVNAWQLEQAWPVRWTGPGFDALAGVVACEELELAFDDVTWLPARRRVTPTP